MFKNSTYYLLALLICSVVSLPAGKIKSVYLKEGGIQKLKEELDQFDDYINLYRDETGFTLMGYAAYHGCDDLFSYLIDEPRVDINVQDSYGCTALYSASFVGNLDYVKRLLAKGAQVDIRNKMGLSVICAAIGQRNVEIVRALLQTNKIVLDEQYMNECSLFDLACFSTNEMIDYTQPALQDDYYLRAKHKEIGFIGSELFFDLLIEAGASLDIVGSEGGTVLHSAALLGNERIVAKVCELKKRDGLESYYAYLNRRDSNGNTPLLRAAVTGNLSMMSLLIEQGASTDSKIRNKHGDTIWSLTKNKRGYHKVLTKNKENFAKHKSAFESSVVCPLGPTKSEIGQIKQAKKEKKKEAQKRRRQRKKIKQKEEKASTVSSSSITTKAKIATRALKEVLFPKDSAFVRAIFERSIPSTPLITQPKLKALKDKVRLDPILSYRYRFQEVPYTLRLFNCFADDKTDLSQSNKSIDGSRPYNLMVESRLKVVSMLKDSGYTKLPIDQLKDGNVKLSLERFKKKSMPQSVRDALVSDKIGGKQELFHLFELDLSAVQDIALQSYGGNMADGVTVELRIPAEISYDIGDTLQVIPGVVELSFPKQESNMLQNAHHRFFRPLSQLQKHDDPLVYDAFTSFAKTHLYHDAQYKKLCKGSI